VLSGTPEEFSEFDNLENEEEGGLEEETEDNPFKGLFTSEIDKYEDEGDEDEDFEGNDDEEFSEDEDEGDEDEMPCNCSKMKKQFASKAEFLRGDAVSSSNRAGGNFMDISKVAQALGMNSPMPIDGSQESVDFPTNEDAGPAKEGTFKVHTTKHKNTAKPMRGTPQGNAAGSTLADDDALQGPENGVEIIEPEKAIAASNKKSVKVATKKVAFEEAAPELGSPAGPEAPIENEDTFETDNVEDEMGEGVGETDAILEKIKNGSPITPEELESVLKSVQISEEPVEEGADEFEGEEAGEVEGADAPLEIEEKGFSTPGNYGFASTKKTVKKAQQMSPNPTQPLFAVQEEDTQKNSIEKSLNVPRSPEKANPKVDPGRSDVKNPKEVIKKEYNLGPDATNQHTDVVPRDPSGDGLGGKKPKFDKETGDKQTSGNPDNYVQKLPEGNYVKPTPVGSEMNHLGSSVEDMKRVAISKVSHAKGIAKENLEAIVDGSLVIVADINSNKIYKVNLADKK
jgi:hypothetical protein